MSEPQFKKYTARIADGVDLTNLARTQGAGIIEWLHKIPDSQSTVIHAPYTWTLRQVLNHLSDCERVFAFRALWMARGETTPMESFEENNFSVRADANRFPLAQLVDEFWVIRQSTIHLLHNFTDDDWQQRGVAAGHEITVTTQAEILLGHVEHHWAILQQRFFSNE